MSIQGDLVKSHTHTQQGTFSSGGPSTDSTGNGGVDHTHSISHSHNVSTTLNSGSPIGATTYAGGYIGGSSESISNLVGGGASGSTTDISTTSSGKASSYNHIHSLSNHTHSTTISGQTSSNDSDATETRPKNYTYIIWRRIA